MVFALFCFTLKRNSKTSNFVSNTDLDVMEEKVIFQQGKTLPMWSTQPGDDFGFQYSKLRSWGMDIINQSSHDGREQGVSRQRCSQHAEALSLHRVPNERCKGALHSLMILYGMLSQHRLQQTAHIRVWITACGHCPLSGVGWGKVSGLTQDSLAVRPQGLSDPLANDWKAEAKCLSWLFFYHQAGHGIWGFPGHSTTSRMLRGSCTDRSNFSTPDCSCRVPVVLGVTPRVTGVLQQHCSTSPSFYSSQDLCP